MCDCPVGCFRDRREGSRVQWLNCSRDRREGSSQCVTVQWAVSGTGERAAEGSDCPVGCFRDGRGQGEGSVCVSAEGRARAYRGWSGDRAG